MFPWTCKTLTDTPTISPNPNPAGNHLTLTTITSLRLAVVLHFPLCGDCCCFHLPYRLRTMNGQVNEGHYSFESSGSFKLEARPGVFIKSDHLDTWLVERYHLYTDTPHCLYRGDVAHAPWKLQQLDKLSYEDSFSSEFGFEPTADVRARYAESLDVRFRPFKKLIFSS